MASVGIIGASGFLGGELARLLSSHPSLTLTAATSRSHAGQPLSRIHPALRGFQDLSLQAELHDPRGLDLVFLATPHGYAMSEVPGLLSAGVKVVDLSADYRLRNPAIYTQWYAQAHLDAGRLGEAIYGIPELYREKIKAARLVANPGCYPTAAALALAPVARLLRRDVPAIVDAKSGTSGAGAEPSEFTHHSRVAGTVSPYKVGKHRHTPEIAQTVGDLAGGPVEVIFTPHLVPLVRGILATCYAHLTESLDAAALQARYTELYRGCRFVRVGADPPSLSAVVGSNFCDLSVTPASGGAVIAFAALDNLGKGGAGQAVQNANIMLGLSEAAGLDFPGLGV